MYRCFDLSEQYLIITKNGTNSCFHLQPYLTTVGVIKILLHYATYIKSVEDVKSRGMQNDKMLNMTYSHHIKTTEVL